MTNRVILSECWDRHTGIHQQLRDTAAASEKETICEGERDRILETPNQLILGVLRALSEVWLPFLHESPCSFESFVC